MVNRKLGRLSEEPAWKAWNPYWLWDNHTLIMKDVERDWFHLQSRVEWKGFLSNVVLWQWCHCPWQVCTTSGGFSQSNIWKNKPEWNSKSRIDLSQTLFTLKQYGEELTWLPSLCFCVNWRCSEGLKTLCRPVKAPNLLRNYFACWGCWDWSTCMNAVRLQWTSNAGTKVGSLSQKL